MQEEALTAKQIEVRDRVLDPGGERPIFDPGLAEELRGELETHLAPIAASLEPKDQLFVNKQKLKDAQTCEGLLYSRIHDLFVINSAIARGTLAHRSVQRLIGSDYQLTPLDAVHGLFGDLVEDPGGDSTGEFVQAMGVGARAELCSEVADMVIKFAMDWPRLKRAWNPRVESRIAASFGGGVIRMSGKVDLAIGNERHGAAGVFIADLKTGFERHDNLYDVRFYALLETLRSSVPPFRIAVYYLDSGQCDWLDVTEDLLRSEVRRVLDGIEVFHRVRNQRKDQLVRNPNGLCPYCSLIDDCEPGQASVALRETEA
ncbi:MAG: hypothetical protein EXQ69_03970 [Acidimicrobiia bacterium]|nr:hypothetical protein [Acidimicrobiia bacterium]